MSEQDQDKGQGTPPQDPKPIDQERFNAIYAKMKSAEERAEEYQKKLEEIERAEAERRGEYQKIAEKEAKRADALEEELNKLKPKYEKYEGIINSEREALLEELFPDEEDRAPFQGYDLEQLKVLKKKLNPNAKTPNNPPPSQRQTRNEGELFGYSSPAELLRNDPEKYEEYRKRKGFRR